MGERGTRYKCYKCSTKFYDLNRPQPVCPSCGEDQNNKERNEELKKKKRRRTPRPGTDVHVIPEDREDMHDIEEHHELSGSDEEEKDKDDYTLETEDMAFEEDHHREDSE